jgi:hypothetical protein
MKNDLRKTLSKGLIVATAALFFAASCMQQQRTNVQLTASETPDPAPNRVSSKAFEDFSHKIPEHKQFDCVSCHQREGRSTKLDYTGHDSCIGCHLNQFLDENQTAAMCTICHADLKGNTEKLQVFPAKFKEGFNMKFDHSAHDSGDGRPRDGCSSCHVTSGPGKTIQSGVDTHSNCFECHTAESKIGSCSVCHDLAPYNRTQQSDYSFRYVFRHSDHSNSCNQCHSVRKAPQGRQVTNIAIKQHLVAPVNNCKQCHNGRDAFNGDNAADVTSCGRCHKDRVVKLPAGSSGQEVLPN